MKELAVLKWHKVGCYATAFATIEPPILSQASAAPSENDESKAMIQQISTITSVQQRRDDKARSTHWLAAGAKDGKVSLWDIY